MSLVTAFTVFRCDTESNKYLYGVVQYNHCCIFKQLDFSLTLFISEIQEILLLVNFP